MFKLPDQNPAIPGLTRNGVVVRRFNMPVR